MALFLLVHGMGDGSWYWRRCTPLLRAHGHEVFAPTLTGVGERRHLLSRDINLETHITDITNVFEFEGLENVTLVGHSYGGMVVTGVADRMRERIKTLIYLDAFVPENSQCLLDLQPPERIEFYRSVAAEKGDGWRIPPPPATFWKLTDPDEMAWFDRLATEHPLATLEQHLALTHPDGPVARRAYIWASGFTPSPFEKFAAKARDDSAWIYREIASGHMPMISHPAELVALFEELAETS